VDKRVLPDRKQERYEEKRGFTRPVAISDEIGAGPATVPKEATATATKAYDDKNPGVVQRIGFRVLVTFGLRFGVNLDGSRKTNEVSPFVRML